jgi:hypothetical protein
MPMPQHATTPFVRTPHVYPNPALTELKAPASGEA